MKNSKNIRSKYVKDSLVDINSIENKIEETTKESLSSILAETVNKELNRILSEAEEDDYEETEVEDTPMDNSSDDFENDAEDTDGDLENANQPEEGEEGEEDFGGSSDDEWAEFEQYKNEDGEYDLANADENTVKKIYKLMDDDDEIIVTNDNGLINIKDNQTGAEYLIDTNDTSDSTPAVAPESSIGDDTFADMGDDGKEVEDDFDVEEVSDDNDGSTEEVEDDETVYEITLNDGDEITEDLGYTTNYQKKTAMTTPINNEPAKSSQVYSMDDGVPTGTEKPFGKKVGDGDPFDDKVKNECSTTTEDTIEEEENVEEATNVGGFVQQNTVSKSHVPNSSGRSARNMSRSGEYAGSHIPRYSSAQMENIKRKAKAIFEENQEIKKLLGEMKDKLYNAAVTNKNLGQIIKLMTENTTTREEKIEIIKRFGNEAKTISESDKLYESISNDLKKVNRTNNMNMIDRNLTENNKNTTSINETKIYQSKDLLESINLMHRVDKL